MLDPATLSAIVVGSGFVSQSDFNIALKASSELGKSIPDVLISRGILSEDAFGQIIGEHFGVPYIKLAHKSIPQEVLSIIPEEAATTFRIIPFAIVSNELHLAMEDPGDLEAREFVRRRTGMLVKTFYAAGADIAKAVGQYKRNIGDVFTKIIHENVQKTATGADATTQASDIPIIKILDTILEFAVAENTSDIHMEALEDTFIVRFRVDGMLKDIFNLPIAVHPAIIARIKILSMLKLDEHRIPQDGRFKFKIKERYIALRVSILPAFFGENIVMRILPESSRALSLEELGLNGHNLELVRRNIKKPHGMILVTGPTGSGKTTTLYSVLNILISTEVKICTIEDPVEYGIKRVNQTQINPAAGLTFAAGLRSLLRHDPDIIMVGEIRDGETVEMAIQSSLTGHLVLSTLHTNDAASTIPRLLDMGAEPFLVASTVNLIIAQRLVRQICQHCISSYTPDEETLSYLKQIVGEEGVPKNLYKGKGCSECNNKGYKGRVGIYEILEVNEQIRQMIIKKNSNDEIHATAIKLGMIPLIIDGINKASSGMTTVEDVLRVVRE